MIQTGKYAVSPKWAATAQGHGMSCAVTTALWVMYISPAEVTITDIEILFFAPERDRSHQMYSASALEHV